MSVSVEQLDHAHFYPEKAMMSLELVVDKATSRVLGLQGACADPDSLKARIDAVAAALQYSKPTVEDISNLEIAYAPPFASAMDVVNVVANVADNALAGRFTPVTADQFMELWHKRSENHVFFIDSRPAAAGKAIGKAPRLARHTTGRNSRQNQRGPQRPPRGHHLQHWPAGL